MAEQVAYYRARAPDYDDVYLGKDWDRCLEELPIAGDVLELACGSGHWTAPGPVCRLLVDGRDGPGPGGRVCFVDDGDQARAGERFLSEQATPAVWRRLGDGSEHRVIKVYYTPGELTARLAELGWSAEIRETSIPLLVGTARRTSDR